MHALSLDLLSPVALVSVTKSANTVVASGIGFGGPLPISIPIPQRYAIMGSQVPITVQVGSFSKGSKNEVRAAVVLGASVVFVETRVAKARVDRQHGGPHVTEVVAIPLTMGWPKSVDAWERTVNLTVPNATFLTTNCKTMHLNVLHFLSMVLKVKSESMSDFRAESTQLAGEFGCWLQVRSWDERHNQYFFFTFQQNNNAITLADVHIVAGQPPTAQHTPPPPTPPEYEQAEELGGHCHLYTLPTITDDELPVYA